MADNLLDKASILLTPTAYNDGSMLSVKPENGDGDFTFSRSSAATRVNAQGLVENVQIISSELVSNGNFSQIGTEEVSNGNFSQEGSELVTNGNFATDSDWTLTQAIISNGSASFATTDGSFAGIRQTVFSVGKTYLISLDVSNLVGTIEVNTNGGASIGLDITTDGTKSFYMKAESVDIEIKRKFGAEQVISATIDNVSVKEVGQDWVFNNDVSIGDGVVTFLDGGSNPNTGIVQSNILTSGKNYKLTFDVTRYVNGRVQVLFGTSPTLLLDISSGVGTYTIYGVSNGTNLTIKRNGTYPNFDFDITNISVKEVGQDWTFGTGWSVDQANSKVIADGTMSGNDVVRQTIDFTQGTTYKFSFTVLDYVSGTLFIRNPFNGYLDAVSANGSYSFDYVAGINDYIDFRGNSFVGSFTNVSVKEITDDTDLPRINYEGFIYQDSLGSEEVVNGDFSNGSANWIVQSGVVDFINNEAKFVGSTIIRQESILTSGVRYKILYEVSSITGSPNFKIYDDGSWFSAPSNIGTHEVYFTSNTSILYLRNDSSDSITIDNVSVKEYLGQEVVPDSGCGSWLLEPQSTNMVTYSEDFSQWINNANTTFEGGYLAPDGTLGATKVSGTIGTSSAYIGNSSTSTQTRTIWARTVSGTGTAKLTSYYQNTNNLFTLTEQWQRFEVNGTTSGVGGTNFYVDFRDNSQTLNEFIVWGAQSENLTYATSYIPTNGATNTRLQDIANNSGNSTLINSTEGVLYFEAEVTPFDSGLKGLELSDGSTSNIISLYFVGGASSTSLNARFQVGGTNVFQQQIKSNINYNQNYKIAFKWQQDSFKIYVDGILEYSLLSGNTFTANTLNNIDFNYVGNSNFNFYGKTKAVAVYKEALTDAQLQSLTTI